MVKKSSCLFCVRDRSFVIFHPHLEVCIPVFLHSRAWLICCQVPLKSLYAFGFDLFQFSFSVNLLTFNLNILQHLPFMSSLLASLGLSSALPLHTCCPTCLFYLYFLFFFTEQLCSSLPLPLSQIIAAFLSFPRFFVKNLWTNLCLVLFGLFF